MKMFDLTGKVALITGGSKGLGKAMARGMAEAGANVIISSRHENELQSSLREILNGTKSEGHYIVADMSKRLEVKRLAEESLAKMSKVDILVNNVGIGMPQGIDQITDEEWDQTIEVNLNSTMALTRELVPQMKERQWGRVIHISSIMSIASKKGISVYSATKSALLGLARASALDLGTFGVTVNCISPGTFTTNATANMPDEQKKAWSDHTALNRWADPTELVGPAILLASDAGSYITGANLVVDGGYLVK